MHHLRVATYNITHELMFTTEPRLFWPMRKSWVADLIKKIDADILCLQEDFAGQARYIVERTGYTRAPAKRSDPYDREYDSILYREGRMTLEDNGMFYLGPTPRTRSKFADAKYFSHCTWARFLVGKKTLFVFSTHFPVPVSDETRAKVARVVRDEVRRISGAHPFIFAGDLNTWPQPFFYRALGKRFIDTFLLQPRAKRKSFNTRHLWPGKKRKRDEERIDYVFISPQLKKRFKSYRIWRDVVTVKGKTYPPSDHCPVSVDLSFWQS